MFYYNCSCKCDVDICSVALQNKRANIGFSWELMMLYSRKYICRSRHTQFLHRILVSIITVCTLTASKHKDKDAGKERY